jgi:hypothetical protein
MQCLVSKVGAASSTARKTADEREKMQNVLGYTIVASFDFGVAFVESIKAEGDDAPADNPGNIPVYIEYNKDKG